MHNEYKSEVIFPFLQLLQPRTLDLIANFRARYNIEYILAISGGSENGADYVTTTITDFIESLKNERIAILTGGTRGGVPELGTKLARIGGLPTIGVFPQEGRKSALFGYLDLAIETAAPTIGSAGYGSETPSFAALPDGMMILGGSFGTLVEVATVLKSNKKKIEKNLIPVYVAPVRGSGGVADSLDCLPDIDKVRACLPNNDIRNGQDAAFFMIDKLGINQALH